MRQRLINRVTFDLGARAYDAMTGQDLWRRQIARVLDHVVTPPRRVLDLGCGPGVSSFVLAQRLGPDTEVVGLDISTVMIERARQHHARRFAGLANVRFMVADATAVPLERGSVDLVVGHSFLYLVPDRAGVLAEVRRVLAPGGTLVLMEPRRRGSLLGAGWRAAGSIPDALHEPVATSRFVASMVAWRLFSGVAGRLEPEGVRQMFEAAGLVRFEAHPTLAGLGMHCVGRAPG